MVPTHGSHTQTWWLAAPNSWPFPAQQIVQTPDICNRVTIPFSKMHPTNTWKTVTDAWNGYHSAPLRESDRHLTTFVTLFCPMAIYESPPRFPNVRWWIQPPVRCCTRKLRATRTLCKWHWLGPWTALVACHRVPTRVGQAGIVLNPDKFQFAERTVDFAGFRVSDSTIEPLPKHLGAIRDFPTPTPQPTSVAGLGFVTRLQTMLNFTTSWHHLSAFSAPDTNFLVL